MPGVQQPNTMVHYEGLLVLTGKTLPARLTGLYSGIIPRTFGHGKRLPSRLIPDILSTNLEKNHFL
jgi:hypothetical protein